MSQSDPMLRAAIIAVPALHDAGDPAGGHSGGNRHPDGGGDLLRSLRPWISHLASIAPWAGRTLFHTVLDTASLTGMLLFIFAASGGFSWSLTVAYVPQRLVALLHGMQNSTGIFMVVSILLLWWPACSWRDCPRSTFSRPFCFPSPRSSA